MSTWRKLKRNHSTQIARDIIFVDCETRSQEQTEDNTGRNKLWFGVARSGRFKNRNGKTVWCDNDFIRFDSADEFWEWARTKAGPRKTTWMYAHNAGFDFIILGLLNRLADGELIISKPRKRRDYKTGKTNVYGLLMLEDPPTIIGLEDGEGCRYVVCDTLNYWRTSLSALGESVGLDKMEMPRADASPHLWTRYCHRDVEVIEQAIVELISWWKEMDLGNWRWTAPGLAMSAFRHRFLTHDIVFHDEWDVRAHERESYFGGQLEAYQLGNVPGPVYQYDVVSLYPYVMSRNLYPTKLREWNVSRNFTTVPPAVDPTRTIAEVELVPTNETFPVRIDNDVFYARGPGRFVLAGPELEYAYSKGYVKAWGAYATYAVGEIFTAYVDFFYELKGRYEREGDQVKRNFVKLLLNSLYGKFAQRGGSWEYNPDRQPLWDFGIFHEQNPFTGKYSKHLGVYDVAFDWKPNNEIQGAAPSIAAFVTSYARQHMRKLKQIAGDGNYFYMSTDSLIVNEQGQQNLSAYGGLIGSDLGQLKLDIKADSAWIGGLHYYRIGDKWVEGSKKASAQTIDEGSWSELQFDSLLAVIKRSKADPDGMDAIDIRRIEKHRTKDYAKGKVTPDGQIIPFAACSLANSTALC